jgi:hypothetical protein
MMTMHFSTFVTDEQGAKVLDWVGGYFDWEGEKGKRDWYSKISQVETIELAERDHPISRGVPRMVQLRDEVYWKLRFRPDDQRLTPIWRALDVRTRIRRQTWARSAGRSSGPTAAGALARRSATATDSGRTTAYASYSSMPSYGPPKPRFLKEASKQSSTMTTR